MQQGDDIQKRESSIAARLHGWLKALFAVEGATSGAKALHPSAACYGTAEAVPFQVSARRRRRDGGAMLLAVLFMMAMMVLVAMAVAPAMVMQIKRDREEEMIHRGTEYARAVRKYYRKFGRYPANLEQLENTNQIRFLRKRYKDPLTKDGKWKLLNYTDIQTLSNPAAPGTPAAGLGAQGLGAQGLGAQGLGAQGLGAQGQGAQAQGAFGQPSAVSSVVANL